MRRLLQHRPIHGPGFSCWCTSHECRQQGDHDRVHAGDGL